MSILETVKSNDVQLLIQCLQTAPAQEHLDLNAIFDVNENNLLHHAVLRNNPEMVTLLLDLGVDPVKRNKQEKSPLDLAIDRQCNPAIISALTKKLTSLRHRLFFQEPHFMRQAEVVIGQNKREMRKLRG